MKKTTLLLIAVLIVTVSCQPAPTATPIPPTPTAIPPTSTPLPTATATPAPPTATATLQATSTPIPSPTPTDVPLTWSELTRTQDCKADVANKRMTYTSGTATVQGYLGIPQGTAPFPALIMVHSASRLTPEEKDFASWFSSQGFVMFAPEYFDAEKIARPINVVSVLKNNVDGMKEDVASGIQCLKTLGYANPNRIGAVGLSFGGYLATLLGSRDDVKAVVSLSGAFYGRSMWPYDTSLKYPYEFIARQVRAPVLIIHGDADRTISVADARSAEKVLVSSGKQVELVVMPGVGHQYEIKGYDTYNAKAAAEAQTKTLSFLRDRLQ